MLLNFLIIYIIKEYKVRKNHYYSNIIGNFTKMKGRKAIM